MKLFKILFIFLLAVKISHAGVQYFHPDNIGSSSLLTNENGEVIQQAIYSPFGEVVSESKPENILATNHLYTGQELDRSSELYYYGARYYDPVLSRFSSLDPVKQHLNPYTYTRNNPINFVDPSGETDYALFGGTFSEIRDFLESIDFIQGDSITVINNNADEIRKVGRLIAREGFTNIFAIEADYSTLSRDLTFDRIYLNSPQGVLSHGLDSSSLFNVLDDIYSGRLNATGLAQKWEAYAKELTASVNTHLRPGGVGYITTEFDEIADFARALGLEVSRRNVWNVPEAGMARYAKGFLSYIHIASDVAVAYAFYSILTSAEPVEAAEGYAMAQLPTQPINEAGIALSDVLGGKSPPPQNNLEPGPVSNWLGETLGFDSLLGQ